MSRCRRSGPVLQTDARPRVPTSRGRRARARPSRRGPAAAPCESGSGVSPPVRVDPLRNGRSSRARSRHRNRTQRERELSRSALAGKCRAATWWCTVAQQVSSAAEHIERHAIGNHDAQQQRPVTRPVARCSKFGKRTTPPGDRRNPRIGMTPTVLPRPRLRRIGRSCRVEHNPERRGEREEYPQRSTTDGRRIELRRLHVLDTDR
jgi:hypothetical protein